MMFPPNWHRTESIESLLREIDGLKLAFSYIPLPEEIRIYMSRKSLLKSSLFSARIEGNPLQEEDIARIPAGSQSIHKREIANIAAASEDLYKKKEVALTINLVKAIHATALSGLSSEAGFLRMEESAIYNQAGIAVYLTPMPRDIVSLFEDCLAWVNTAPDPTPIKAALGHVWFEKIHPFLDGNGRVGRLLTGYILLKGGYDFGGLVPFEQYLDEHRELYYDALAHSSSDATSFIEFFLEALVSQAKQTLIELKNPQVPKYVHLLPRRAELVEVIRDHNLVTFDFLARRFRSIATSTLHNDMAILIKQGYIKKLGTTKGSMYVLGENKE